VIKVSVIVPVFDPGRHIDDCIASLLDQSLPATEYEAIFVDDGSTDGTGERLDALAAEHDHARVTHIPNSGWPGTPRNVGLGMARGEFVLFVDNDDWMEREALERLYAMAVADDADVVVGKVVGQGKFVPRGLFRENLHGVTLEHPRLLALLSPHKLFRKALLDEHGIRFPEGRRRLEDHIFVMHAYFHARRVSVLADYPCYHWVLRDPDTNASYRPFEPASYFEDLRDVLDLVEEHTQPGPFRDRLMRHWYRGKMLGRVGGPAFLERDAEYNRALHAEVRRLALERFGAEIDDRLPFNLRVRSQLLREGSFEALAALAEREGNLRADARLAGARREGAALALDVRAELAGPDDTPLTFSRAGDRLLWNPPKALRGELDGAALDVTAELAKARVDLLVKSLTTNVEYALPAESELRLEPAGEGPDAPLRAVVSARARLNPATAAAGARLRRGEWRLEAVVRLAGFTDHRLVRMRRSPVLFVMRPHGRLQLRRELPAAPPQALARLARRLPGALPAVRLTRRVRGALLAR